MAKLMIEGYKYERCGHVWKKRDSTIGDPEICHRCKSAYWNQVRPANNIVLPKGSKVICEDGQREVRQNEVYSILLSMEILSIYHQPSANTVH
jgi:hypothetical protein